MRMRALDSFHASGTGMFHAGDEFEVDDHKGREFEKAGLAVATGPKPDAEPVPPPEPGPESEPAEPEEPEDVPDLDNLPAAPDPEPIAKADPPPKNKSAARAKTKAGA